MVLYPETGAVTARHRRPSGCGSDCTTCRPITRNRLHCELRSDASRLAERRPPGARLRWADARVYLSMTDLRGAKRGDNHRGRPHRSTAPAEPARTQRRSSPCQRLVAGEPSLVQEARPRTGSQTDAQPRISGAQRIASPPLPRDTTVDMRATGPRRASTAALPDTRTVTRPGLHARRWRIPFLARGAPGAGVDLSFDS